MTFRSGRHFLQIPGPTNVPDRILRAINQPTIDHRGPEFASLGEEVLAGLKPVFNTECPVIIYPASGTGAGEAALVNTLSTGEKILTIDQGFFANIWRTLAGKLGLAVEDLPQDWRRAIDYSRLEDRLRADTQHEIGAVVVVHNETSTGVTSRIDLVREALDSAGHPALLIVDAVSSLGSTDYRHDEWGVDVTLAGSQKGLMLPPGLGLNCISEKALQRAPSADLPRGFWDWGPQLASNRDGYFPYTPATNLLYGLREALAMLEEEGLENTFSRHRRLAQATQSAATAWGLEMFPDRQEECSVSMTAVTLPAGFDSDQLRATILEHYDLSLGTGLGPLKGKLFRIGHLGSLNELMLCGTLCGVEMGLRRLDIPHQPGVQAALDVLSQGVD